MTEHDASPEFPVDRTPPCSVKDLATLLDATIEHVVIDVREEGVFARGHLLFAASVPLSRLELRIHALVPRQTTPIVLVADAPEDCALAATRLTAAGYTDVRILDGGNAAWAAAGYQLFSGIYVPSKAFGEVVEHANHTPRITAAEVEAGQQNGLRRLFVDSRPLSEFQEFNLPGATDCPGAELVLRAPAAAAGAPIVVNCAGRTRSIIGAQSLINAGITNVVALENGTMGWHLIGKELERGAQRLLPVPEAGAVASARERATRLAQRLGVHWLDAAALAALRTDATRTTYCFDVRLPEDYAAGHPAGFLNAPGGQLVQSTDFYAPVRNARVVLFDTHGVQAPMTAHWLAQMGIEVFVIDTAAAGAAIESGTPVRQLAGRLPAEGGLDIAALTRQQSSGNVLLIDVDDSRAYRRGHLPGAYWLTRSRIGTELARHCATLTPAGQATPLCVLVANDPDLAALAAADAHATGLHAAWLTVPSTTAQAVLGSSTSPDFLCPTDDAWYSPYQVETGIEAAMRDYISWETGLLEHLDREPGVRFHVWVGAPAGRPDQAA